MKLLLPLFLFFLANAAMAQDEDAKWKKMYAESQKTEVYTPVPPVVAPAMFNTLPPSDAIVLVGNERPDAFHSSKDKGANPWFFQNGVMVVEPGTGDIETKAGYGSVQLHLEWKAPVDTAGLEGQARSNSGVFFQNRYEVQILDSYRNPTYTNGQAGAVYKQHVPLANPLRPTGEWQVYDIVFNAPQFNAAGAQTKAGTLTVFINGVLVQNNVEILGTTEWIGAPKVEAHPDKLPIKLQDHGNRMAFRNIWLREL